MQSKAGNGGEGIGASLDGGVSVRDKTQEDRGGKSIDVNPKIMEQFGHSILVTRKARRVDNMRDNRNYKDGMNISRNTKEDLQNNRNVVNKESTPCVMKDKVSQAVLEGLGLLKDKDLCQEQIEDAEEKISNAAQVTVAKLGGSGRSRMYKFHKKILLIGALERVHPILCKAMLVMLGEQRMLATLHVLQNKLLQL